MPVKEIFYSETYKDDMYEYRHVILPPEQAQLVPRTHLLTETEWRNLGLQMSAGWVHFMLHNPDILSKTTLLRTSNGRSEFRKLFFLSQQ
ncbi:unnamed protein product [Rotaria sordida]|uniref:Cyclin-dependent kinases regulatory subunit n=1 Tax=Rotaria sordida TaxID=392033 RepID=A0A818IZN2_9BILA|nr:unnamed protein product [Rotaria sordida]